MTNTVEKKQPALHMMIGDYFKDPLLGQASLISRAVWYELLMFMWESDRRGEIITTATRLMGLVRCRDIYEILHFMNELIDIEWGFIMFEKDIDFPVTSADCNTKVTIRNRRMYAEFKNRQNTRLRVEKHRRNKKETKKPVVCNTKLTPTSSITSSITITKDIYCRVISYLNKKTGKSFKSGTKKTQSLIKARINEKFTEKDFYTVIDNKCSKWITDPKMMEYLRPETLFGPKFESYLNEIPSKERIVKHYIETTVCRECKKPKTSYVGGICMDCYDRDI